MSLVTTAVVEANSKLTQLGSRLGFGFDLLKPPKNLGYSRTELRENLQKAYQIINNAQTITITDYKVAPSSLCRTTCTCFHVEGPQGTLDLQMNPFLKAATSYAEFCDVKGGSGLLHGAAAKLAYLALVKRINSDREHCIKEIGHALLKEKIHTWKDLNALLETLPRLKVQKKYVAREAWVHTDEPTFRMGKETATWQCSTNPVMRLYGGGEYVELAHGKHAQGGMYLAISFFEGKGVQVMGYYQPFGKPDIITRCFMYSEPTKGKLGEFFFYLLYDRSADSLLCKTMTESGTVWMRDGEEISFKAQ